jgi:hypothetical protein
LVFFAMLCGIVVLAIIVGSGKPAVVRDLAAAGDFDWS